MRNFKQLLLALATLSTTAANAMVITDSDTFNVYTSASNYTYGSYTGASSVITDAVNLSGFDASLGTLTDVEISFTSSWNMSSSVSARDSTTEYSTYSYSCGSWWSSRTCYGRTNYRNDTWGSVSAASDLTVNLIDPASSTTTLSSSLSSSCSQYISGSGTAYCSDVDSTGTAGYNDTLDLSSIDINEFIKTAGDTVDLNFVNDKSFSLSCDNNDAGDRCSGNVNGNWSGTVTVAYTYDEAVSGNVPEPGIPALLGIGLLGMMLTRKKMRA